MKEARVAFRPFALFILALLVALPARPQDKPPAMSVDDVMTVLKYHPPSSDVIRQINKLGISFEMTSELERKFRRAGADDDVIAALKGVSKPDVSAGIIEVHTQPGEAQVYLNDELRGMSSPEGRLRISSLAPGSYTVRVSLPGYQSWQRDVTVTGGQTASVMAPLVQSSPTGTVPAITTTTSIASGIPIPGVKVDEVKFFESGTDVPDVDKRTYQTVFSSSAARQVYYELNLSWGKISSRIDFDLDAVWYDPAGNVIHRGTHPSHVMPEWNGGSVHADNYGCDTAPCNTWATPGTYTVELFVKGVKVATGAFQIAGGTPTTTGPTATGGVRTFTMSAIPLPNVSLHSLKLFESGQGTPDEKDRVYQTVFSKDSTRYVNWELYLNFGTISTRTDWDINTSWYGPDGTVFARTVHHAYAMPDWHGGSMHVDGWGCNTAPCSAWTKPGNYAIELYVRGVKIASATFQVQ